MSQSTAATLTPQLAALVARVREVVPPARSDGTTEPELTIADRVAEAVRPALRQRDLLRPEHQVGSGEGYRQHLLYVEPGGSFSVVALVWLPGQATPVHDHVSWCAVGVYRGEETEIRYRLSGHGSRRCLQIADRLVNAVGSVSGVAPPGDIHQVMNTGPGKAISIHVYGADISRLGSSINRCYDLPIATP